MQYRDIKIHTKMTNFMCIYTTRQISSILSYSAHAHKIYHFCVNFYEMILHSNFCHNVHPWMHCRCAKFQKFLSHQIMFLEWVLCFH
uniref:Uncharacterized protein n=1 Tax=Arundo donax TaxID=35708 RepID=A0A0A9GFK5_ARUDO